MYLIGACGKSLCLSLIVVRKQSPLSISSFDKLFDRSQIFIPVFGDTHNLPGTDHLHFSLHPSQVGVMGVLF